MHVLLTNDDGIDAPGLAALELAVSPFAEVTVVAPARGYSGCGHQVTSYGPISVEQIAPRHFKVDGTPADCTRLGLAELATSVDWVLSGVNLGGNMGVDIWMSGTVAAAREAVLMGTPAMAFSQYVRRERTRDWPKSEQLTRRVFQELLTRKLPTGEFWNVNLPDVDTPQDQLQLVDCPPEPLHLEVRFQRTEPAEQGRPAFEYQGDYRQRPRTNGSDVDVCFGGRVAISRLSSLPR